MRLTLHTFLLFLPTFTHLFTALSQNNLNWTERNSLGYFFECYTLHIISYKEYGCNQGIVTHKLYSNWWDETQLLSDRLLNQSSVRNYITLKIEISLIRLPNTFFCLFFEAFSFYAKPNLQNCIVKSIDIHLIINFFHCYLFPSLPYQFFTKTKKTID